MVEIQKTFDGQFAEAEAKQRSKTLERERLELAMTAVGLRPKHTAWVVAILIHNVATGDRVLRWSATRIANDAYVERSERSVRAARQELVRLGLVEFVMTKSVDGGADMKAMRLHFRNIYRLANGESIEVVPKLDPKPERAPAENRSSDHQPGEPGQNLQGEMHPANHPANHPADHPANSDRLYGSIGPLSTSSTIQQCGSQAPGPAAEAVEILHDQGDGLSRKESERVVAEHAVTPDQAADAMATYKANRCLRSAASVAYWFDHGEWPAERVRAVTASQRASETVQQDERQRQRAVDEFAYHATKRARELFPGEVDSIESYVANAIAEKFGRGAAMNAGYAL